MWRQLAESARKVIFLSQEEAQARGNVAITPEHVLLAILRDGDSTSGKMLQVLQIDPAQLRAEVAEAILPGDRTPVVSMTITPQVKRVFDCAHEEAMSREEAMVAAEHLLLALARVEDCPARNFLLRRGGGIEQLGSALSQVSPPGPTSS